MSDRQKFANFLRICSKKSMFEKGLQAHAAVLKMGFSVDTMINNDLTAMYGKCNRMDLAHKVFDKMIERNVVSWTTLMCGYSQMGDVKTSLSVFCKMGLSCVKPNEFTFSTNLKSCAALGILETGLQIHGMSLKSGFEMFPEVGNSVVDMYSKCGMIMEASRMFDEMPIKNVVTCNAMIAGYTREGYGEKSLILFRKMQEEGKFPDEFTCTSALKACSNLRKMREGKQIHSFLITKAFFRFPFKVQTIVSGALIDLYVSCAYMFGARKVFDMIEQKNVISWTALILGYVQEGNLQEAMRLFKQLRESGIEVDGHVLSSIISVFADLALVEQGKQMHGYTIKVPYGLDISVSNSTLDMYLKCGLIDESERFFDEIPQKNVISWTVMITGYGKHGLGTKAIFLFNKMSLDNIDPDGVTYLAVLSACSHSGLVDECREYFSKLCNDQKIKPKVEHYACMVDLLGRAGQLDEAKDLILNMPLKPNIGIWQTLLSACRVHRNLEMGKEIGEILLNMDSDNPVNYVLMSNIYADAGDWRQSQNIRDTVKTKGLKKEAGQSWVEIHKEVHFFYGGDDTHPLSEKIHEILQEMENKMKQEMGYAHRVSFALHDIEDESKEENLRFHSERLAIGLALVCGGLEAGVKVIRIFKNLRVCGDCHEFIKGLSKVSKKVFVVRDANRFHKFEDGLCSCGDYW